MKTSAKTIGQPIPRQWAKQHRQLMALREHFLAHRNGLVLDTERPVDLTTHDFADEAADALNHDLAASVLHATDDVLLEIDAAIRRIENGTYGVCEITGNKIPARRRMAIPWTRYTAPAEAELERRGKAAGLPPPKRHPIRSPRIRKR
jgi:RNA polymerase-binding transcription factor DksA